MLFLYLKTYTDKQVTSKSVDNYGTLTEVRDCKTNLVLYSVQCTLPIHNFKIGVIKRGMSYGCYIGQWNMSIQNSKPCIVAIY